jgi:hypothetical protein
MRATMRRTIRINGIVGGDMMRDILEIFPRLESKFTRRKQFDEFWFSDTDVDVDIDQLHSLTSQITSVIVNWEEIIINN